MILNITDTIDTAFKAIGKFVEKNYSNPVFWSVLFLVLLGICVYVIKEIGNK